MSRVYTVSQLNTYIRGMFRQDILLSSVSVAGEVSNVKYHPSGHIYFSLKDASSQMAGVMFQGMRRGLAFPMKNGDRVVVTGQIDVYERGGTYQIYARTITREGAGDLYEKFLALKKELLEMGMFDARYKRPIPRYAFRVGVVTASTGAAIRDIEQIAARRNPYVQLYLMPAQVQGEGAAASIASAIERLDRMGLDVMIVGRGGGSIEDLWAFNERVVAEAVFACSTPVISAVGHETDTTIIDFVADLRAPTPSAAAEMAVFDLRQFQQDVSTFRGRLDKGMERRLEKERHRAALLAARLRVKSPEARLREMRRFQMELEARLVSASHEAVNRSRRRMEELSVRLTGGARASLAERMQRYRVLSARLAGLNPAQRLAQGFSFVENEAGRAVRRISDVGVTDTVRIFVTDGSLTARVEEIVSNAEQ